MTLTDVKAVLYELTDLFFKRAMIVWAEQDNTTPKFPYVTLKTGNLKRSSFHDRSKGKEDERYFHMEVPWEINVYSKGKKLMDDTGRTVNYEDTTVSDLNDFFLFIDSEATNDWLVNKGITIVQRGDVMSLTDLQHENSYRYRAFVEAIVTFSQTAEGYYGLFGAEYLPNPTGGGLKKHHTEPMPVIEEADIMYDHEGGINDEE